MLERIPVENDHPKDRNANGQNTQTETTKYAFEQNVSYECLKDDFCY